MSIFPGICPLDPTRATRPIPMSLVLLLFGQFRLKDYHIKQASWFSGRWNVHFGLWNSTDRTISSPNICRNPLCPYMDVMKSITTIYSILGNNWPPSYGWGQKTSALIALNCRLDCLLCPKKVKRKVAPCFKNFGAIWKKCKWSMRANSRRSGSRDDSRVLCGWRCYGRNHHRNSSPFIWCKQW